MLHNISPVNLKRPEDPNKEDNIGIRPYLYAGFAIRFALVIYGDYHDSFSDVKFTGIKINKEVQIYLMPCPFTGPKMFCAGPNFLSQPNNLFTYCASHKHFVPDKKMICIQQNCFCITL
jgi:hypothetical protein